MIMANGIPDTEDYIELLPLKFIENIYGSKASSHFLGGNDLAVLISMAQRGILDLGISSTRRAMFIRLLINLMKFRVINQAPSEWSEMRPSLMIAAEEYDDELSVEFLKQLK